MFSATDRPVGLEKLVKSTIEKMNFEKILHLSLYIFNEVQHGRFPCFLLLFVCFKVYFIGYAITVDPFFSPLSPPPPCGRF